MVGLKTISSNERPDLKLSLVSGKSSVCCALDWSLDGAAVSGLKMLIPGG